MALNFLEEKTKLSNVIEKIYNRMIWLRIMKEESLRILKNALIIAALREKL